jgi:hypothetical protein
MKKYKVVRIPVEAYLKEKSKADEMNKRLSQLLKKNKRIPMTSYFKFRAERPMFIYDDELLNYFGKSKRGYINL